MTVYLSSEEIPAGHFSGGDNLVNNEDLRDIMNRMKRPGVGAATMVASAAMTALTSAQRYSGMVANVGGLLYYWHATSTLTADALLVVAADDAPAAGRWLLLPGQDVEVVTAVTFATADAAALYTAPTGAALLPRHLWWESTADWTGGASSTIGTSSDAAGASTKGDLLGGAAGDAAAVLVAATYAPGARGATLGDPAAIIAAGEIWRFDRITSAFTAGTGNAHMIARVLANAGA